MLFFARYPSCKGKDSLGTQKKGLDGNAQMKFWRISSDYDITARRHELDRLIYPIAAHYKYSQSNKLFVDNL